MTPARMNGSAGSLALRSVPDRGVIMTIARVPFLQKIAEYVQLFLGPNRLCPRTIWHPKQCCPTCGMHPVGLLATIAQGSLILDDACADEWLRRFFSTYPVYTDHIALWIVFVVCAGVLFDRLCKCICFK